MIEVTAATLGAASDGTPRAFWADPPWAGGRTPYRLGLQPVSDDAWLPAPICQSEYQRKLMLLAEQRESVLADIEGGQGAAAELGMAVEAALRARGYACPPTAERHPLARAALLVPDDLCILRAGAAGYRLVAACLCSPSYWRLGEKIGQPLSVIHAPVPGLEAALGPGIARFMENLPVGRVFVRRNWNIHRTSARFQSEPECWEPPPDVAACAALFVRSERQTLRKYPDGSLLFTIGVSVHPLAEIAAYPAARSDLLAAIAAMTPPERKSFGYRHHGAVLVDYLRSF